MEEQYINNMLQELEKSNPSTQTDDSSMSYYKSLLRGERAKIMSQTENGLGIKDIILEEIYPNFKQQVPANHAVTNYNSHKGETK